MNLKRKKDIENQRRDGMREGKKRRNHERRFAFFSLANIMWVGGSADTDGRFCALVVFGLYIQTSETTLDKESSGEGPAAVAATTTKKPSAQFCTHHCLFHYFRSPSNSTEQKFLMLRRLPQRGDKRCTQKKGSSSIRAEMERNLHRRRQHIHRESMTIGLSYNVFFTRG